MRSDSLKMYQKYEFINSIYLKDLLLYNQQWLTCYCCIATTMIQLYTYTVETKSTIMTNELTSLEKYTSHTLFEMVAKGLRVRGELETEQTATY